MKTSTIVIVVAAGLAAAAIATTLVISTRGESVDARRPGGAEPAMNEMTPPAPGNPDQALPPPAHRRHRGRDVVAGDGGALHTPEPVNAANFSRNAARFRPERKGLVKDGDGKSKRPPMMPTAGPAAADRIVGRSKALRGEGRFDEADKLLKDALRSESNPFYRRLIENELKAGRDDRKPADSKVQFK